MGALNEFISGAIWLALIVALGFTGWRSVHTAQFRAVSESYHGRKAQNLGAACLLIGIVAALFFVRRVLAPPLDIFFLLGAALGGYLTYRHYARMI